MGAEREREREKEEKKKKEKKWCWVRIYRKKSYTFREVTGIVRVRACVREREREIKRVLLWKEKENGR